MYIVRLYNVVIRTRNEGGETVKIQLILQIIEFILKLIFEGKSKAEAVSAAATKFNISPNFINKLKV